MITFIFVIHKRESLTLVYSMLVTAMTIGLKVRPDFEIARRLHDFAYVLGRCLLSVEESNEDYTVCTV